MIALSHCGPAMWQTSAAVGIGLLVLFPADLLLISRFGWLMASLIGAALIGDLVLLPSLLVGPLGIINCILTPCIPQSQKVFAIIKIINSVILRMRVVGSINRL